MTFSLFIHPENQTILWNLINQQPLFSRIENKEEWFRNIISQFHEKMQRGNQNPTTKAELLNANKQTVQYMVQQLNEKYRGHSGFMPFNGGVGGGVVGGLSYDTTQLLNRNYEVYNPAEEKKRKQDQNNESFNRFEAEYHSMLKPIPPKGTELAQPLPPEDKMADMEGAVKNYEKMRELDLAKFMPPAPPIAPATNENKENSPQDLKQKIQEISAKNINAMFFPELNQPSNIIISPPSSSSNWNSFTISGQENYMKYA